MFGDVKAKHTTRPLVKLKTPLPILKFRNGIQIY